MVTKIEGAFLRDYEEAESTFKDLALAQSDSDNSQLHLSPDWDSLILEQEAEAQESEANMSILLVRVNADSFNGNMAQTLHRIIGRSNHLSYIGKDLYAAILLNCNAPKLAAYVSMVRSCLGTLGVDHKVGHAVRNNSRGFQAAYDQAMVNVSQDDPLLNVA